MDNSKYLFPGETSLLSCLSFQLTSNHTGIIFQHWSRHNNSRNYFRTIAQCVGVNPIRFSGCVSLALCHYPRKKNSPIDSNVPHWNNINFGHHTLASTCPLMGWCGINLNSFTKQQFDNASSSTHVCHRQRADVNWWGGCDAVPLLLLLASEHTVSLFYGSQRAIGLPSSGRN